MLPFLESWRGGTIRQIVDELWVSKQTVYKRFKGKLHMAGPPYVHTEQGEALIKQDFLQDDRSGAVLKHGQQANLMTVLQATIDTLQEQLEMKGRQIEQQAHTITRFTDALVAAQQMEEAAQALHTGTDQQCQEQKPGHKRS